MNYNSLRCLPEIGPSITRASDGRQLHDGYLLVRIHCHSWYDRLQLLHIQMEHAVHEHRSDRLQEEALLHEDPNVNDHNGKGQEVPFLLLLPYTKHLMHEKHQQLDVSQTSLNGLG